MIWEPLSLSFFKENTIFHFISLFSQVICRIQSAQTAQFSDECQIDTLYKEFSVSRIKFDVKLNLESLTTLRGKIFNVLEKDWK